MAKPVFQVLRSLLILGRASSACGQIFRSSQSALCTTAGKYVFMVWFSVNGWNIDLPWWQNRFSRCWGAFWILVDQLSWVKMCPGEVSQHYITTCHCSGLRKVFIHGLIQVQMVSIWTGIHGRTVLSGFEEACGIRGRVFSTGGKVLRWALLPTAVCSENVYSWFDPVKLAKVLTGIHESAGFPGLEELFSACCQWLSCNAFNLGYFWCHCCIPWPWKCRFWCHICHTFDSMDHLIMRYCVGCRPSWKMVPCANRTHCWRCRHAVSWSPHLNDWF